MKKIISVITTFVMLVSLLSQTAVFAAFSDVDDANPYKQSITTLSKLGVIDGYGDGTFKPSGEITRAEFTKLVVYLLGHQNITYNDSAFSDVKAGADGHWASNFIQTAYGIGIISGMGDGTFAPDSAVTYEQALKMVVCMLGYEQFAEELGVNTDGWADKYIKQANSMGLTKNVSNASYSSAASRGLVAQVLYNALEIEMYENNNYEWIKTNKTLMNDYLNVKKVKGTLIGVSEYITEDCPNELLEDEMAILTVSDERVMINFKSFTENVNDISKFLGNTITAYYRQPTSKDEKMLVTIDSETTKNSQINIKYEDLVSLSGNTFKYYQSGEKTKSVKLKENDLTVRYNGKLVSANDTVTLGNDDYSRQEALELWLSPDTDYTIYGDVKLTDTGSDGTIDMIQINDYETMVAYAAPTSSDYRITNKLVTGNYLVLDPQAADYSYTIIKNNTEIPVTSIAANDVILCAKSLDGSQYSLLVSNEKATGNVSSMNTSTNQITIGGKSYNIGDKCISYIKEKSGKDLKVGVSGTFYIDSLGTVVFGELDKTETIPYAYIIDSFVDYDEGGKDCITIYAPSISTSDASSYPLKDKIKLNGVSTKSNLVMNALSSTAEFSNKDESLSSYIYGAGKTPALTGYSQPAKIKVKDGIVTEIITVQSDELQSQNDDLEQIVKCKELGKYRYSSNGFTQNGKNAFSVNSSTVVLYVPRDRYQTNKYAKKSPSSAFSSGDEVYVEAFDINSSKIAGLVILYGSDSTLTKVKKDTDFSIVAQAPESVYNEKTDENSLKLSLFAGTSSAVKNWTTYDDREFSDVEVGDVIQFAYDSDQLAQGLVRNIKFSDIEQVLDGNSANGQLYSWQEEQTPSEDNNYQKYKFDYRFKRASGSSDDETYTSSTLGTIPYSRACMYNVSQVLLDEKKLYVTKGGFNEVDGTYTIDDSDYEEITITSSTRILRMEDDGKEISKFAANTTTDMSINDLKDAKNYGQDCSKILVCSMRGTAKTIVVYK